MTIELYNEDNLLTLKNLYLSSRQFDIIYGDCIYESNEFLWTNLSYEVLKTNGIFILQTDWHSVAEYKVYLDKIFGKENFINWISVKFEWGGTSKRFFPRKTDFLLIYSKGKGYKFYPNRIQIPKITAGTNLDKKGTGLKTPCDCWDDMAFSTLAKERVKMNGRSIQWQKSLKFMNRILLPFTDEGDWILDPFLGSGTTAVWAKRNNRNLIGIENSKEVFDIASNRINNE